MTLDTMRALSPFLRAATPSSLYSLLTVSLMVPPFCSFGENGGEGKKEGEEGEEEGEEGRRKERRRGRRGEGGREGGRGV